MSAAIRARAAVVLEELADKGDPYVECAQIIGTVAWTTAVTKGQNRNIGYFQEGMLNC